MVAEWSPISRCERPRKPAGEGSTWSSKPSAALTVRAARVAILTDLSGATMQFVTGNIVSAPCMSTATSTFSRRMISMAP